MTPKAPARRSGCPIAFSLELLGDRWTLLVIRDLVFARKRYFREFLDSPEGIASNILASRLRSLEAAGIVTRSPDPDSARQVVYALTAKGIDLIPMLLELIRWGAAHDPRTVAPQAFVSRIDTDRARLIEELRESIQATRPA